jgi:hypothetical protein
MSDENFHYLIDNFDSLKTMGRSQYAEAVDLIQQDREQTNNSRKRRKPSEETHKNCISCGYVLCKEATACPECAICQPEIFVDPTPDDMKYKYAFYQNHSMPCAYKRINHFNEKMAQFQGKEKTIIPDSVIDSVKNEVSKYKLRREDVNPSYIRKILKKLKYSKYYEHVNYITSIIGVYQLPYLTQSQEDTLRQMFHKIQIPFGKHSPSSRKNFLNYAYIFRKFLELQSLDCMLENFSELKSREKLYEQDRIWKSICCDLDWEFIPSI